MTAQQPTAPWTLWDLELTNAIGSLVECAQAGASAKRWPKNAAKELRSLVASGIERFMTERDKARAEVGRLKDELAKAQQQPEPVAVPSDEDETIRKLFNLISVTGLDKPREVKGVICYLISITKKLARRIGAKL